MRKLYNKFHNKITSPLDIYQSFILFLTSKFLYRKNDGFFILKEEWDNLIILDACRYDFFQYFYTKKKFNGRLEKKISRGTHTIDFLKNNFQKEYYDDIIYITSTPYVDLYCKEKFYKIISVWKDGWAKKHFTVLPETMYNYTIKTLMKYPNKKLIIHFIQPHYPYIGYSLNQIKENLKKKFKINSPKNDSYYFEEINFKKSLFSIYMNKFFAVVEQNFHLKAYMENLRKVLNVALKLLNVLPGTTVISTDHGEAFGEPLHRFLPIKFYGHTNGIRIPSLKEIPWLTVKADEKDPSIRTQLTEELKITNTISKLEFKI